MPESNKKAEQGLVISYFGNSVAVETASGQVFQCHLHRNQDLPVVGDQVLWEQEKADAGTITSILPRRSLLSRGEGHGKTKPIAANIDVMMIVLSTIPVFSDYLVDRYLIAAELLKLRAMLVLNKIDLLDEANLKIQSELLEPYRQIGYHVVLTSAVTEGGLDSLNAVLKGKTAVLVGPSGVGKSSIISALGHETVRVGEVSAKGSGKHTTTATRLYHLPDGANLIDSPGVREFNLWPVTKQDVLKGFKEFHAFLTGCKFRDCAHLVEPGCAVQDAVASGKISAERFKNYQALMKQATK